jgi:trimethylamine:corrinoid methyltransferase-like protein
MSERALLSMLMGVSGLDILGGAGQLEVATVVSPLQVIVDNEVISMVRNVMTGFTLDDENLAYDVLVDTKPGDHFLTADHTLRHCRESFIPQNFIKLTREDWELAGSKTLMDRLLDRYHTLMEKENPGLLSDDLAEEVDSIAGDADKALTK